MASRPGAVLGVVDAVSCGGGDRGGGDAELAVQGRVASGGAVMSAACTSEPVPISRTPGAAVCIGEDVPPRAAPSARA